MAKASQEEIRDLLYRASFNVILKEEIPDDANVLTDRNFLANKSKIDGEIRFEAMCVIGGHRDFLQLYLAHYAHTL